MLIPPGAVLRWRSPGPRRWAEGRGKLPLGEGLTLEELEALGERLECPHVSPKKGAGSLVGAPGRAPGASWRSAGRSALGRSTARAGARTRYGGA